MKTTGLLLLLLLGSTACVPDSITIEIASKHYHTEGSNATEEQTSEAGLGISILPREDTPEYVEESEPGLSHGVGSIPLGAGRSD